MPNPPMPCAQTCAAKHTETERTINVVAPFFIAFAILRRPLTLPSRKRARKKMKSFKGAGGSPSETVYLGRTDRFSLLEEEVVKPGGIVLVLTALELKRAMPGARVPLVRMFIKKEVRHGPESSH